MEQARERYRLTKRIKVRRGMRERTIVGDCMFMCVNWTGNEGERVESWRNEYILGLGVVV